jgi:hypothetical protein
VKAKSRKGRLETAFDRANARSFATVFDVSIAAAFDSSVVASHRNMSFAAGLVWSGRIAEGGDARVKVCAPPEYVTVYPYPQEEHDEVAEGWGKILNRPEKEVKVMWNGYGDGPHMTIAEVQRSIFSSTDRQLYYEGSVPLADNREWFDVPGDVLRNYAGIHTRNGEDWRTRRDVVVIARKGHIFPLSCEKPWGWQQHMTCVEGRVSDVTILTANRVLMLFLMQLLPQAKHRSTCRMKQRTTLRWY